MRVPVLSIIGVVLLCLVAGCQAPAAPPPQPPPPQFKSDVTIREIMQSMVAPKADIIWDAVSTSVTDKGVIEKVPKTDEDWLAIRHDAITLVEATNSILIPGRHVAKPGDKAEDPKVQLPPEQIEALINQDRANFNKLANGLYDSVLPVLRAIEAKDKEALLEAGDAIDRACEGCHFTYWYPKK